MIKKITTTLVFYICLISNANSQTDAESMANFIKQNNKTTAICVIKNNQILINNNANKVMPIGTTSDLLVAMEFAKQCAYKILDTAERVPLKNIVKYYFENSQQPEYEEWLTDMLSQKKVINNTVSLLSVVQGMLQYGSQPNAEYIMDRVGFDNIKSSIKSYNLSSHTAIFPTMGALAIYQNRVKTSNKKMLKSIDNLTEEGYCKSAFIMHQAIKNDSTFKQKLPNNFVDNAVLKMWTDRLPNASIIDYATLCTTILKEKMLDPVFYKMLRNVLEWPMQYSYVNNNFIRYSKKESKTMNSFTQVEYGKTKDGNEVVIAYTFTKLNPVQLNQIQKWHNEFETTIYNNPNFLRSLISVIKK